MSALQGLPNLASLPSPIPEPPPGQAFTEKQWEILFSIMEVFVPEISTSSSDAKSSISTAQMKDALAELKLYLPEGASEELAKTYLAQKTVSDPIFIAAIKRKFNLYVPPSDAQGLAFIFSTMNTRAGSYLLTGYTTPIHLQPLPTRTEIVCKWSTARLPLLRTLHCSLGSLARFAWINTSTELMRMIDYPHIPKHIERNTSFEYKFHDFTSTSTPTTLSTDVIIVGSGCGAGVTASHLSRAGLKVLVLERAYHFPSTHFPMRPQEAGEHLYLNGGVVSSDDGSVGILAGSTLGGGGTVNWSASLQPQYAVRKEWADGGLPHFLGDEFQDCLDTVCSRMGVAKANDEKALSKIEHNFGNTTLLEGARRLGMAGHVVPQNSGSKPHLCGSCIYGCPSTTKQGPLNNWFPDAAAHGAEFIEGCLVDEVIFSANQTATGVKAIWTSRDRKTTRTLTINAKRVIIAAGTLSSPLVLLRSGLTNPQIGANLYLHPTNTTWAVWKHRTDPWDGTMLTSAVTSLEDQDGLHHGVKLEVTCAHPGLGLLTYPWRATESLNALSANDKAGALHSALRWKIDAAKHGHAVGFIAITRDQDTGRAYIDPKDPTRQRLRVAYTTSARDRAKILEGILANARLQFIMGAQEIDTGHTGTRRFVRPSGLDSSKTQKDDDAAFNTWLAEIKAAGLSSPDPVTLGSAHQMGTCRMSSSAKTGVVDSKGRVWGTKGLYVADASCFPTASGVNPMITTMGIAEWVSRGIVAELGNVSRTSRL
ncbi:hypothetical protein LTR84_003150 [Exophiala bonariae]|uniref:Long-chain-alcohol oxidase n=1 Tax=Exophiala bonariae TaxID=1690606 RepID=A0AAV9N7V5_9EURO|nr:hypothetical protein LTR84_003150 [Exophiala bonariae]